MLTDGRLGVGSSVNNKSELTQNEFKQKDLLYLVSTLTCLLVRSLKLHVMATASALRDLPVMAVKAALSVRTLKMPLPAAFIFAAFFFPAATEALPE